MDKAKQRKHEPALSPSKREEIIGEFLEIPGLRLTVAQARRLWGLDSATTTGLLGALVEAKFLFRTEDGAFVRAERSEPRRHIDRSSYLTMQFSGDLADTEIHEILIAVSNYFRGCGGEGLELVDDEEPPLPLGKMGRA